MGEYGSHYTTAKGAGISFRGVFTESVSFPTREPRNTAKQDETIVGRWLTDRDAKIHPEIG
jgi:hypothetical protein